MDEGERLRFARNTLNVNQGEFCKAIGLSHQSYLSGIENGTKSAFK